MKKLGRKALRSKRIAKNAKVGRKCSYRRTSLTDGNLMWFKPASRRWNRSKARQAIREKRYDEAMVEKKFDYWWWD